MSMNRRELGGTLLGLAAAVGLSPVQIPAKVDQAHVRYFSAAVDQLYAQDQSIGGGALVRDGLRLYDRARRMLDESDYSEATARQLMSVAGELATCVSWLCYDAGDYRTGRTLHSNAHMLASQAGDNRLAIRVMQGMALQLVDVARESQHAGYARQAVVLSKRASELARSEPSPQLHALLAAREAMAQAAVGDFTGFNRAISRAWREMDREDHTEELPRWLKFVNRSEIVTHEARGRWYLGKLSTAEDLYRTSLQDELSPRNEAAQRASLAAVLAARHDFESALTEGTAVLSSLDTRKIRSSRTIRRLRAVRKGAAKYASGAEFAEHYDQIASRGGSI